MSRPAQLIIGGIKFPTQTRDRYRAYETELKEQLAMVDGSMVEEVVPGKVQIIEYSCDAMSDSLYRLALAALRAPGPLSVAYLPDDGSQELRTSTFFVTAFTPPSLSFFRGTQPLWHNMSFTLREARPHHD